MPLHAAQLWDHLRTRVVAPASGIRRRPDDIEAERYQSVHLHIWFWTTIACVLGGTMGILIQGFNPIRLIWFVFAAFTGLSLLVTARWPRYRAIASTAIYVLNLSFTALVFYNHTNIPVGLAYPGLLAVLTGVAVGEAPRRAFGMGLVCLTLVATLPLVHQEFRTEKLMSETAGALISVVGLMFCGLAGAVLWTVTLDELKSQAAENQELAQGVADAGRELEIRVQERTDELTARSAELRARTAELRQSLQQQERLKRDLAEISVRDELTGLHNRRYFLAQLEALAEQSGTFTMLLIDLDHFKAINDDFGHPTGDHALRVVTQELAAAVRTDDVVARIGGEEFAVLLPATPQPEGEHLAEHLRRRVEDLTWAPPLEGRGITISIGVAGVFRGEYVVTSKLMTRADRALYQAKMGGRNRVVADTSRELPLGSGQH